MALTPEHEEDFRRFVEVHWLGLVHSTSLIVGDRDAAEDLVEQTLAHAYRHWDRQIREGSTMASVRGSLVDRAIAKARRMRVRESLAGALPSGGRVHTRRADARDGAGDLGAGAPRGPRARTRAVVVLRCVDGLSEDETADVIGLSLRSVRARTSRGLQWLRDGAAGATGPAAAPDAYARVMAAVDAHRRRRLAVMAGSGTAALVLAGVLGLATGPGDEESLEDTPATDRLLSDRGAAWRGLPFGWPARGELGTDPGFTTEFARHHSGDHLLYAEDGEAGRVVIAVSSLQETVVLHGPRGAELDALARVTGRPADSRQVVVSVPHDAGHLVLVLLPENVNEAQISAPTVQRDGSIDRRWRQLEVDGGVGRGVSAVPPWVSWVRSPAGGGPVAVRVGPGASGPSPLTCGDPCDSAWFAGSGLSQFEAQVASVAGVSRDDISARLVLDAPVPAGFGPDATGPHEQRLVVYAATLPSGGVVRSTYLATTGPAGPQVTTVDLLTTLPASGAEGPVFIPATADRPALIVAPGVSSVGFIPRRLDAAPLPDVVLVDGVGIVPGAPADIGDHAITTHDATGAVRGRWHGGGVQADNPFGVPSDG